jgi:putative DNA methylase
MAIPRECKRLAEVDFPIAEVSRHSAREKFIRHGHPSTLHLWWARRPLAACRAMLLGLLLPDPCDPHCPKDFTAKAAKALLDVPGWASERMKQQVKSDEGLRRALLAFIGDVADWDVANNSRWIGVARQLVKAAHPDETPVVVDPFAGGGAIPLEAMRVGCDAIASDLNPVACLINRVMIEDIPRHGLALGAELRRVGDGIRTELVRDLAAFYPDAADGAKPVAYIWARTVRCESPNCGAEIPLVRSFWLSRKAGRKRALQYSIVCPPGGPPQVELCVFEPTGEKDVPPGTVNNGKATCPACHTVLAGARVQSQLREQRGGACGARLLAVVVAGHGQRGRDYRRPSSGDIRALISARRELHGLTKEGELPGRPLEQLSPVRPSPNARGVSAPTRYGASTFGDLFTDRQLLALLTLAKAISSSDTQPSVRRLLAMALDKVSMQCSAHCRWKATGESLMDMFGRHALSMVWDFAESNPLGTSTGGWETATESLAATVDSLARVFNMSGQVLQGDACEAPWPDESVNVWFTDPPYYDNIPYADLSDFFFVWLKRTLSGEVVAEGSDDWGKALTPKEKEAVWDLSHVVSGRPKGPEFFEQAISRACKEGRRILTPDGIGGVVFAHKTTEGWEALLAGIVGAGWLITASWPIATEMTTRVSARDSASLATSVHLVCRPRPLNAPVGDWGEVLRELPNRVGDWMERLQSEGVRGADLIFACIGPALEIFSRYSLVETADGRKVELNEYLEKVWEVVGRIALEQVLGTVETDGRDSAAGALEEDARLTALFLWTLQTTDSQNGSGEESKEDVQHESDDEDGEPARRRKARGSSLVFDIVRRFAQPLGIDLPKWEGRVIETKKGVVRLLPVHERARQLFGEDGASAVADWIEHDPTKDLQQVLFPELERGAQRTGGRGRRTKAILAPSSADLQSGGEATTLDRVHAAMLLQAGGQTSALRALIKAEQDRGPDFLRLANALSALYPSGSEEKRLLDAMLLAVPR